MLSEELTRMLYGETPPCISIVVPLQDIPTQDKKATMLSVEKACQKAADFLQRMYPEQAEALLNSLDGLVADFDLHYDPTPSGLGLYVSPDYCQLFRFPFPVQEKIHIADTFSIREVLYLEQYAINYFVVHLSEKSVQCYKGSLNRLEEVRDGTFPLLSHDDYEYSQPSSSTSYSGYAGVKGFEKDKSTLTANRLKSFYREADRQLGHYLGQLPLVVAGPKKDIASLEAITRHKKNIIAAVNGSYANVTIRELEQRVWPAVKSWIENKEHTALLELMQQKWQQRSVEGIRDVWQAAKAGKGYKLLVEKDYACPAFLEEKSGKLHLKSPKSPHQILMDAAEDVMKLVKKKGEVIFLQNGALADHQHIALITRY